MVPHWGQEKYKMSLEHLVVTESKKAVKTEGVYVPSTQEFMESSASGQI